MANILHLLFIFSFFWGISAQAGDVLGLSLNKLGVLSNVNKAGTVQNQLGGYMTGGSIHTRNQVSNVHPVTIQPPSLSMGCGGIDLFKGGFGYINSAQLEALMKNIGSSALTYGSILAIKTISPQISDILSQLESMARFLNAQNINSCQMGASIAAGMWPKNAASQDLACQARKMGDSKAADFFTARYDCSKSDKAEGNKNEYKGLLGTEFNLVHHALKKKNSTLTNDDIELFMSISGTLISKPENGSVSFAHKPSLLKEEKLLELLVYGQQHEKLKLYKCNDKDKCINVNLVSKDIGHEDALLSKIRTLISSIAQKFLMETHGSTVALAPDERNLAENTAIPIVTMVALEAAFKGHSVELSVDEYAELITFDFLIHYLDSVLDEVYEALAALEYSQIDGEPIRNFKEEVKYIKSYLYQQRQGLYEHLNTILSIKQRMIHIETMVKAAFAEHRSYE